MSKDDKIIAVVVSIFAVVSIVFAGGYYLNHQNQDNSEITTTQQPPDEPPSNDCYTPDNVREHYGETHCVDFSVGYTYETSAGTKFIDEKQDYKNGFVVYVPAGSNFSSVDLSQFDGKKVRATGLIKEYNGYPEIEATEYSQVSVN